MLGKQLTKLATFPSLKPHTNCGVNEIKHKNKSVVMNEFSGTDSRQEAKLFYMQMLLKKYDSGQYESRWCFDAMEKLGYILYKWSQQVNDCEVV